MNMYDYRVALIFVVGLYIFSPVILDWWLSPHHPWYQPFAIWFVLISIYIGIGFKRDHDDF